jgi:hypothetical protein
MLQYCDAGFVKWYGVHIFLMLFWAVLHPYCIGVDEHEGLWPFCGIWMMC